ncbi:aspartic peptidase domain-containing protein [Xylaria bambusicola]|uniref:aspartic peptidase domain-containing protein n=1 Tax=Xylaria bambusicola TaxID=326684 RepID=UPI0020076FE8|nr:aspartic peptidase domain-containing protein [Xylaria bambusicola]KAI0522302.1 aspartic peptidase domain-containing protein [Xylaria bambusicola]
MRTSLACLAALATPAVAQKVVSLSFARAGPEHKSLRKRAGTYSQELNNNLTGGGYYADVALGTPPQPVTLILDTGSSDVWVLDTHADLCQSQDLQYYYGTCLATYNPDNSSTYELVDRDAFSIQYLDTSGAEGDYIRDTFHVGGASIKALQVGLAENSTINSGLLGIGFSTNVAASDPYPNIIDLFVEQDLIDTSAYSLYLDDLFAETGTILFGGIDTRKFIGQLKSVDILRDAQSRIYSSFTVALNSLTIGKGSNSESSDLLSEQTPVILDSGTTLTYLPPRVARQIYQQFNAYDDTGVTGLVYADCGLLSSERDTTLNFQFGGSNGPVIKVPMRELVLDNVKGYIALGLELPRDIGFDDVCSFGIQSLQGIYLLGDTFLRSAYVVYDLDHKKIALAQANLNSTETNVMEITAASGIPLVSGVAAQETHTAGGNNKDDAGNGSGSGSGTGSGTDADDESTTDNAAPRALPVLNWEATAVAVAASLFSLVGAGLFVL